MIKTAAEERDPHATCTTQRFHPVDLPDISEQRRGPVGSCEYSNLGYAILARVLEVDSGHA